MDTFPAWTAALLLIPIAALLARHLDRPRPALDWGTLAVGVGGALAAVVMDTGRFTEAIGMMLIVSAWFAALICAGAVIEQAPAALRGVMGRDRRAARVSTRAERPAVPLAARES